MPHRQQHSRLEQLTSQDLGWLAQDRLPPALADRTFPQALPPAFVAIRSLAQLQAGQSALWCLGFCMVADWDDRIVGSCGFKGAPVAGQVEIGYGVSPHARQQGHATRAVADLITIAAGSLQVRAVLAQVNPDNLASTRVVQKLGFTARGRQLDHEGEMLVQWVCEIRSTPQPP